MSIVFGYNKNIKLFSILYKHKKFISYILLSAFLTIEMTFPNNVLSASIIYPEKHKQMVFVSSKYNLEKRVIPPFKEDPFNNYQTSFQKIRSFWVTTTAYSSTIDQTDDTPFITAKNTFVRDGVVAANFLPFGTRIRIPQIFGDKVFIVEDRMNKRYWKRIDIWMKSRSLAKNYGIKYVQVEIVKPL